MRGELPGMRNNRPNFQFDGNACGAGALGEARGIIAQDFVRADDAVRRIASTQKRTVKGNGILHSSRKPMLRREAIVRSKNAKSVERIVRSDRTVRLRRAAKVPATVKIDEHNVAGHWTFEAFTGDATEMCGRNLNCWRSLISVGAKNLARDAIIAHAFQTALDAPFDNQD